jgi:hypothetical protein
MECGIIYIKICPPRGNRYEWIKYCYLTEAYPKRIKSELKEAVDYINTKFADSIVYPVDFLLHPGCTTTPEMVDEIANEMYSKFVTLCVKNFGDDFVRCVYSTGNIVNLPEHDDKHNVIHRYDKSDDKFDKFKDNPRNSTHAIHCSDHTNPVLIKVGHYLDSSDDAGIYKI